MIERQVIVTWEKPEDKLPEPCVFVAVTVSAELEGITYDHALEIADWNDDGLGWCFQDVLLDMFRDRVTVHAWADLEPYEGN